MPQSDNVYRPVHMYDADPRHPIVLRDVICNTWRWCCDPSKPGQMPRPTRTRMLPSCPPPAQAAGRASAASTASRQLASQQRRAVEKLSGSGCARPRHAVAFAGGSNLGCVVPWCIGTEPTRKSQRASLVQRVAPRHALLRDGPTQSLHASTASRRCAGSCRGRNASGIGCRSP